MGLENLGNGSYRKTYTLAELEQFGIKNIAMSEAEFAHVSKDLISSLYDEIQSKYDHAFEPEGLALMFSYGVGNEVTVTVKPMSREDMEHAEMFGEFDEEEFVYGEDPYYEETAEYKGYDGTYELTYGFVEIEDAMEAVKSSIFADVMESELYHHDGKYVLYLNFGETYFAEGDVGYEADVATLTEYVKDCGSLLAEYGDPVDVTSLVLREYGKKILETNALERLPKLYDVE